MNVVVVVVVVVALQDHPPPSFASAFATEANGPFQYSAGYCCVWYSFGRPMLNFVGDPGGKNCCMPSSCSK